MGLLQLVLASRISYVGDLGWELYVPMEQGLRLWEELWAAGQPHGLTACGMGVYGTTGRLEKSFRAYGTELDVRLLRSSRPGWPRPKGQGLRLRRLATHPPTSWAEEPVALLLHPDGRRPRVLDRRAGRYMLGRQPIVPRMGADHRFKGRRSYATSAGGRVRRSASTSSSRTCRPSTPSKGQEPVRRVLHRALPGDGGGRRPARPCSTREPPCAIQPVPWHEGPGLGSSASRPWPAGSRSPPTAARSTRSTSASRSSPHEECAVEEAVRLVEANGGEAVVLTLGPEEALERLREALALGVARGHPPRHRRRGVGPRVSPPPRSSRRSAPTRPRAARST